MIVKNKEFENVIVKLQTDSVSVLNDDEKPFAQRFAIDPIAIASTSTELDAVEIARQEKKRRKIESSSSYRPVRHVLPTSNIVERLFSQAKLIMTDQRKHMSPDNLDTLSFLKYNKCRWGVHTVQAFLDQQAIPQHRLAPPQPPAKAVSQTLSVNDEAPLSQNTEEKEEDLLDDDLEEDDW